VKRNKTASGSRQRSVESWIGSDDNAVDVVVHVDWVEIGTIPHERMSGVVEQDFLPVPANVTALQRIVIETAPAEE